MRIDGKKNYDLLLAVARTVVTEEGAGASLRDIARKAGVGLATLYRHFPTREALLEALLRAGFDELTVRAAELESSALPADALVSWLRETVAVAHRYRGVTTVMMAAIEDPDSALHSSCVTMRAAGGRLLARAQAWNSADRHRWRGLVCAHCGTCVAPRPTFPQAASRPYLRCDHEFDPDQTGDRRFQGATSPQPKLTIRDVAESASAIQSVEYSARADQSA
jgi:AcrR family transcriptional regulator